MNEWQLIETAPAKTTDEEPVEVLLWVPWGGSDGKGCVAFGHVYIRKDGSIRARASGYLGNSETIQLWQPVPEPPLQP